MSDQEEDCELYCRLCAEPTSKEQLIYSNEDVAISSMIATKMLWINIDITTSDLLPTTICFSCFDLLERTWTFLHNVRTAQVKLKEIFKPKVNVENGENQAVKTESEPSDAGKPVNKDWDQFANPKTKIKLDPEGEIVGTVDPNTMKIKLERNSPDFDDNDRYSSTDSDIPLQCTVKKRRKATKKKKVKFDIEILPEDLMKTELEVEPFPLSSDLTWNEYLCHCATCDAACKNISSLRLHAMQIHYRCCVFKCSDCGKAMASFKSFVNHVRGHKAVLRYCCEYCNKVFTLPAYLKKHLNTVHRSACLTTCQNCGMCFETEEQLEDHLLLYSKRHRTPKKIEKYERDLKCEDCGKEFKTRSNLAQHKLVHTERSRDYSCHICGKMFFTKGTLSTHIATHEDAKPYKCEYCPMAFRARGNLTSHISLHSGAKPFVCEQCGKSFRVKRHLKSHSIVHTDLMPYICEYCNKSFRFKTRLNLHLRQHTGAKPYNCVYCQRDFTNGSNYKKHMKRRHNIDTSKKRYNNVVADGIESNDMPVEIV